MKIAVVIPCYKVTQHIQGVISKIPPQVDRIYAVDDACPDNSGNFIAKNITDPRVKVLFNERNLGVGGAVKRGYIQALIDGADIIIKLDGDGQMSPYEIENLINPILLGRADYTKGNRFSSVEDVAGMPFVRLFGNGVLSFITKLSSGYWGLFDPTNGYTAIHRCALSMLPMDKIADRYFFESDILFRLNTLRAVVVDIPMKAVYQDEISNMNIMKTIPEFLQKNLRNFFKRILYNYFLRNFSVSSLELLFGTLLSVFAIFYGGHYWWKAYATGISASTGNVVLPAMCLILGFQLILSFLNCDIENAPDYPLQLKLGRRKI